MMEVDFPLVRAQFLCPLCQGEKAAGLLVCWPCFRRCELKYGNPQAEAEIARYELKLSGESGLVASTGYPVR
jgi:hypothetical protein